MRDEVVHQLVKKTLAQAHLFDNADVTTNLHDQVVQEIRALLNGVTKVPRVPPLEATV